MKKRFSSYSKYFIFTIIATLAIACEDDPQVPQSETKGRMVLVYQVANNNLSRYSDDDYNEMLQGAGDIGSDNHLLVYRHSRTVSPMLVEVKANGVDTLYTYDTATSSVDISRVVKVIEDAKKYANAEQYGLVLWSHGSGWIQDGMEQTGVKRSFGDDGGKRMNSTDLATALQQAGGFDWIYFDCCYMMSVETLYELRNTAKFFVGSVTELQLPGMPYHLNMKYFFAPGESDLVGAAQSTFDYYLERIAATPKDITNNYCTMSVVKASALDELARVTRNIYAEAEKSLPDGFVPQRYSNVRETSCNYFDFGQYANALAANGNEEFNKALADAVLYDAATKYLRELPIEHHSGMSTYILRASSSHTNKNYQSLSWYHDVASVLKF